MFRTRLEPNSHGSLSLLYGRSPVRCPFADVMSGQTDVRRQPLTLSPTCAGRRCRAAAVRHFCPALAWAAGDALQTTSRCRSATPALRRECSPVADPAAARLPACPALRPRQGCPFLAAAGRRRRRGRCLSLPADSSEQLLPDAARQWLSNRSRPSSTPSGEASLCGRPSAPAGVWASALHYKSSSLRVTAAQDWCQSAHQDCWQATTSVSQSQDGMSGLAKALKAFAGAQAPALDGRGFCPLVSDWTRFGTLLRPTGLRAGGCCCAGGAAGRPQLRAAAPADRPSPAGKPAEGCCQACPAHTTARCQSASWLKPAYSVVS